MSQAETIETFWKPLCRLGGVAFLVSVAIVPVSIVVFSLAPPPSSDPTSSAVVDWFTMFQSNLLQGLLDGDLLFLIVYVLFIPEFLAIYVALRKTNASFTSFAVVLGAIVAGLNIMANRTFSMLSLSNQYVATSDPVLRSQLVAAGQALLAMYEGAHDVTGVLAGVAILVIGLVMLRSRLFGKATAYLGIVFGILTFVPGTAGTIGAAVYPVGVIVGLLWEVLVALRLFQLGRV